METRIQNFITVTVTEPEAKIKLPRDIAMSLGLPSVVTFHFLNADAEMPKKNAVVIVKHDDIKQGDEKIRLACGKILWSRQVDVETEEASVLVSIRSKGAPAKLRLSTDEWEHFRPLAVINQ